MTATYGARHRRDRIEQLESDPWCHECGAPATVADHDPPVSVWELQFPGEPWQGQYLSHCARCSVRQGGELARIAAVTAAEQPALDEVAATDFSDPVWAVDWLADLLPVPDDASLPRYCTISHPATVGSYGLEVEASADRRGVNLRWWQRFYLRMLLQHDADGRLLVDEALIFARRQVGKTWGLREYCDWRLHTDLLGAPQRVIHTARQIKPARECIMSRLLELIDRPDEYHTSRGGGVYSIEKRSTGATWRAMSANATNGETASAAVIDEAWDVTAEQVDENIGPTTDDPDQSQMLFASAAHSEADPMILARREVALERLSEPETGTLIVEWSAARFADPGDPATWRAASPCWKPSDERMFARLHANAVATGSLDSFRAQRLGIWPTAASSSAGDEFVDLEVWADRQTTLAQHTFTDAVIAIEDVIGTRYSAVVARVTAENVVAMEPHTFATRDRLLDWLAESLVGVSAVLAGVTFANTPALRAIAPTVIPTGATETNLALPILRRSLAEGDVLVVDDDDLKAQALAMRVRPSVAGKLTVCSTGPTDLVRCCAWAARYVDQGLADPGGIS